jgi:hypothetical protein
MLDPGEKSNISLVFGILMLLGGIIGVTSGTLVAQVCFLADFYVFFSVLEARPAMF